LNGTILIYLYDIVKHDFSSDVFGIDDQKTIMILLDFSLQSLEYVALQFILRHVWKTFKNSPNQPHFRLDTVATELGVAIYQVMILMGSPGSPGSPCPGSSASLQFFLQIYILIKGNV